MTKFSPRFTEPSEDNPYYLSTLNPCIVIDGNSVLPNCVGYANGRSRELSDNQAQMPACNAVDWMNNTSYETGTEPRLGAVICWSGSYGHVGVVEAIDGDTITVSQSNYGGTRWFLTEHNVNDLDIPSHPFMGFIYNPYVEIDDGLSKQKNAVYRFYNISNGLHFMTADYDEAVRTRNNGWTYEGVAFFQSGDVPVYRFYNPNMGEHMYTVSDSEKDEMVSNGWKYEGIAFYSRQYGDEVYRLYNGGLGHHFTTSASEVTTAVKNGWQLEGIGWYE